MRMTSTGAFRRTLAAARPPKPPPTITTRGVFDVCSSAPLIELRLASFIHPFLKLLTPEISENLGFSRRLRWPSQRYVSSAKGAALMPAWGSAPGSLMDCERALKARLIDLGFGMNRAFSADGLLSSRILGRLPQANMKSAPMALNTYGPRRTDGRAYQASQKLISRIRISVVTARYGIATTSILTLRTAGMSLSTFGSRSKNR